MLAVRPARSPLRSWPRRLSRLRAGVRAVDRMPTSVDDLVEVAELAERLLLAAPDPDDVGELLRGPGSCGESAVGGFWHGSGREGKRAHDEVCGQGPERGGEDGSKAQAGEHVADGARGQGNNRTCPRGGGAGGARAPWRIRAMASASETTSRTRMRPPHLRQRVMSMAKMRARSFAHAMRRGRGEELGEEAGESSARAKSSASCGGGGGTAGFGMTRSRRRWWLASAEHQAEAEGEREAVSTHAAS